MIGQILRDCDKGMLHNLTGLKDPSKMKDADEIRVYFQQSTLDQSYSGDLPTAAKEEMIAWHEAHVFKELANEDQRKMRLFGALCVGAGDEGLAGMLAGGLAGYGWHWLSAVLNQLSSEDPSTRIHHTKQAAEVLEQFLKTAAFPMEKTYGHQQMAKLYKCCISTCDKCLGLLQPDVQEAFSWKNIKSWCERRLTGADDQLNTDEKELKKFFDTWITQSIA